MNSRSKPSLTLLLTLAIVSFAPVPVRAADATSPPAADLPAIPPGPRPFPVTIGGYLIDLERIDESAGMCALDGYLDLEWVDPRLQRDAAPALDRNRLTIHDIWWPNIEFYNQYDARQISNVQINVSDDGTVEYQERFNARLSCDLDFRQFPFDRQRLPMQIESFRYDAGQLGFHARPARDLESPRAFLPDWFILGATERTTVDEYNPDQRPYAAYVFTVEVQRKSASYIWNMFLPIALITLLSGVVFWIRNKDFTNIAITTLVAAVAFAFVVAAGRPRQQYLTFMDAMVLSAYVIIFLSNVAAVALHYTDWTGRVERAAALTRTARWAFPLLYVALVSAAVARFFVL